MRSVLLALLAFFAPVLSTMGAVADLANAPAQMPVAFNLMLGALDPKVLQMQMAGTVEEPEGVDERVPPPTRHLIHTPHGPQLVDEDGFIDDDESDADGVRRCWCCKAYVCRKQRCPCSKFML